MYLETMILNIIYIFNTIWCLFRGFFFFFPFYSNPHWPKILGLSLGEHGMRELQKRNLLVGVKSCKLDFCKYYLLGKQCKVQFETSTHNTKGILDYFHSDILEPAKVTSKDGSRYYMSFIDYYSWKVWVYFFKSKSNAFAKSKKSKSNAFAKSKKHNIKVENQTGRKVIWLKTDNDT